MLNGQAEESNWIGDTWVTFTIIIIARINGRNREGEKNLTGLGDTGVTFAIIIIARVNGRNREGEGK